MKRFDCIIRGGMALALSTLIFSAAAADTNTAVKPFPTALTNCVVSGEKLGGDMGEPYVFTNKDREIKLCCKNCLKEFQKDPAKYIKKIEEAEAKAKSPPTPSPLYTCPMASHADVVSDKPGTCSKCGMKLVETSKVKHGKTAEENWRKSHPADGQMGQKL